MSDSTSKDMQKAIMEKMMALQAEVATLTQSLQTSQPSPPTPSPRRREQGDERVIPPSPSSSQKSILDRFQDVQLAHDERRANIEAIQDGGDELLSEPSRPVTPEMTVSPPPRRGQKRPREEEEGEEEGEPDILDAFFKSIEEDESYAPPIDDKLAKILTTMIERRKSEADNKALWDQIKTPRNVPLLKPPRVNQRVWNSLSHSTRTADINIYKISEINSKMMTSLANLIDRMNIMRKSTNRTQADYDKMFTDALKTFQIGVTGLQEANQRRRNQCRDDLRPEYRVLCNAPEKEGEELFGPTVDDRIKTISGTKSIAKSKAPFLGQRPYPTASYSSSHTLNNSYKNHRSDGRRMGQKPSTTYRSRFQTTNQPQKPRVSYKKNK